LAAPQCCSFL